MDFNYVPVGYVMTPMWTVASNNQNPNLPLPIQNMPLNSLALPLPLNNNSLPPHFSHIPNYPQLNSNSYTDPKTKRRSRSFTDLAGIAKDFAKNPPSNPPPGKLPIRYSFF